MVTNLLRVLMYLKLLFYCDISLLTLNWMCVLKAMQFCVIYCMYMYCRYGMGAIWNKLSVFNHSKYMDPSMKMVSIHTRFDCFQNLALCTLLDPFTFLVHFGSFQLSADGSKLLYIAERKKPESVSYFKKQDKDEGKDPPVKVKWLMSLMSMFVSIIISMGRVKYQLSIPKLQYSGKVWRSCV